MFLPEGDSATDSENDDVLNSEDMEALRQACTLTATTTTTTVDSDDSDLELLRSVQNQLSVDAIPLSTRPLCQISPSDDEEDDFETLLAIQRRFTSLSGDMLDNETASKDTFNHSSKNASNGRGSFLDDQVPCISNDIVEWDQSDVPILLSTLPLESSSFPKSAHMFFDAIRKNRLCQKFIRSKLIHIEARIEENKNHRERFKILKDFQTACRRRTGAAFSQKKDPRALLISAQKAFTSNNSKIDDKKVSGMYSGPAENSHVGNYRMALTKYPQSFERKKWADTEKENLGKGIRQQFQEMMLQISIEHVSHSDVSAGESNSIDSILETIKDHEISLDPIREFLPKVNWDQLASMYVAGRSGAECEARWLNCEDPLINHSSWTEYEDKNLLRIIQENGISNWVNVAASLRTNRTPQSESVNSARKCKRKQRVGAESDKEVAVSSKKKKRAPKKPMSNNTSSVESGNLQNQQDSDNHSLVLLPPNCLEVGTANGCGIEASTGTTTRSISKKRALKKPLRRNSRTEELCKLRDQQDVDNQGLVLPPDCLASCTASGHGIEASNGAITSSARKKRALKNPVRRNLRTEESGILQDQQDMDNQGSVLLPDCLESGTANGYGIEASNGATTRSISKKRAPKKTLKSSNISTRKSANLENRQDMDYNQTMVLPPGRLELGTSRSASKKNRKAPKKSSRNTVTSGDPQNHEEAGDIDTFMSPGTTAGEKGAPRSHSRRKISKKPPTKPGNGISSTHVRSEAMINDGDRVESQRIDKVASSEKHCTLELHQSGNNVTETSVENHDFVSMAAPQKGIRKLKLGSQSLSNQNKETAHTMSRFDCSDLHSRLHGASEEHQMFLHSGTKIFERPPKNLQVYSRRRFRRKQG